MLEANMAKVELTEDEMEQLAIIRAQAAKSSKETKTINTIKFGSKEHENSLRSAYGMTREEADIVIEQRAKDFTSVDPATYQAAKGLVYALTHKPAITARLKRPLSHAS